jgi:cytochrome c2
MLSRLPNGTTGYIHYADLASLPQITVAIVHGSEEGDENFSEISKAKEVRVTGVSLETLAQALGALPGSDLIAASCTDGYRAHYPAGYIAVHHPILGLRIDHLTPAAWASREHQQDLGPYFITHSNFKPAFKVLAHADQPQVPTNIVRLDFGTTASTFGSIMPRGNFPPGSLEEQGFAIAKQNCLRCHNQGPYGGIKSGRTWMMLSTWAREQPAFFSAYVHNPKAFEPNAKMPGNPTYDAATLAALTAYFRTFTATPVESNR